MGQATQGGFFAMTDKSAARQEAARETKKEIEKAAKELNKKGR